MRQCQGRLSVTLEARFGDNILQATQLDALFDPMGIRVDMASPIRAASSDQAAD